MPSDTRAAPSITDAALLRMATAGPNWQCAYCRSHQRRSDGTCQQCGAPTERAREELETRNAGTPKRTPWGRFRSWARNHKVAVGASATLLAIILLVMWVRRERSFTATVEDARWTQVITVERYQIWSREGWRDSSPRDAFDVVSLGQKVHHYDDVLDGYDTQYYTEQVACGQDCQTVPETCHESCSDNGNGFATCRTTCSGGGTRCSTRYCSEQRSRQVPRYRKEPRYAEAISYKIWDWGDHRSVQASGRGTTGLRWPTDEAKIGQGLGDREQERERRSATYEVKIAYDDGDHLTFDVTLEELPAFEPGSKHPLRIKGDRVIVDGKPRVAHH